MSDTLRMLYKMIPVYPELIQEKELTRKVGKQVSWRFAANAPILEEEKGKRTFYAFTSLAAKQKWLGEAIA